MHFDLVQIIQTVGYIGLFAIVFAESGLFFGFFLPGDSLLLTAGLLASQGKLEIAALLIILPVAAILGDNVGYWFGKKTGSHIFNRDESLLFRRKNLLAAQAFYDRHGGKTIILARFMPFIRTFAPIVAGAVEMPFRRFFTFNVIGGLLWGVGVTLAGYYLGQAIPGIDRYFLVVVGAVILVSALPAALHMAKEYGPSVRRLIAERLGFSRGRGELASVPVEVEPDAVELHDLREHGRG
jgi:membrane-associated protein